jgi:hypothetical protein
MATGLTTLTGFADPGRLSIVLAAAWLVESDRVIIN